MSKIFLKFDFSRRRSCQILVIFNTVNRFSKQCNRKTAYFAVTPHEN